MTLTTVLLTGGESRRMGKDKATIGFRGEPLWKRQVDLLRALTPEKIFVSARTEPSWLPHDAEVLLDDPPSRGPLSGLTKALAAMRTTHLLALAVDMPFITGEQMRVLCSLARIGCGVMPMIGDRAEPLAAIYSTQSALDFTSALAGSDFSLQTLARKLSASGKVQMFPVSAENQHFYRSVNEPGDLKEGRFPNRPPENAGGLETAAP